MLKLLPGHPAAAIVAATSAAVLFCLAVTAIAIQLAGPPGAPLVAYAVAFLIPAVFMPLGMHRHLTIEAELAEARADLERLAHTDALTGLPNRRGFFARASAMFDRPVDARNLLTAIVVDVDGLKAINDESGHDFGDAVLCEFGAKMGKVLAESGASDWLAARIGGDEFAVLVEGLVPSAVGRLAEGVCRAAHEMESGPGGVQDLTVSAGVAFRKSESDVDGLLKMADGAVYLAKRGGGDRWSFALEVVDRGPGGPPPVTRQSRGIAPMPCLH